MDNMKEIYYVGTYKTAKTSDELMKIKSKDKQDKIS